MVIQACLVLHNFAITRRDMYDPLLPGEKSFQEEIALIRRKQSRNPQVNPNMRARLPVRAPDDYDSESEEEDETSTMSGKEFRSYIANKFF
jgi:hypothetical protein